MVNWLFFIFNNSLVLIQNYRIMNNVDEGNTENKKYYENNK